MGYGRETRGFGPGKQLYGQKINDWSDDKRGLQPRQSDYRLVNRRSGNLSEESRQE